MVSRDVPILVGGTITTSRHKYPQLRPIVYHIKETNLCVE